MIEEGMIRNLSNLMMAIIIALSVFLCITAMPETGFSGWEIVHKPTDYPTSVDPYEVIVYEHANFVGEYIRFKLEPGMRQRLIPDLKEMNDRISSIQVGSKVGVMVFDDADFRGGQNILYDSQKVLHSMNDVISSLIVFPKEWTSALGVMLIDMRWKSDSFHFFPLPEALSQTEARYATLGGMNDDANRVTLFPHDPKSSAYGKVQMTLYEHPDFKGRWITLPGADGSMPDYGSFDLGPYQFGDIASSLIVRWVEPPAPSSTRVVAPSAPDSTQPSSDRTPPPPSSVTTTTPSDKTPPAPAASSSTRVVALEAPDVSGRWKSSIGFLYIMTQQGSKFKWTVVNSNEKGEGTMTGNDVSASWKGQNGSGSSAGKITNIDSHGNATEIKWENGVRFYR